MSSSVDSSRPPVIDLSRFDLGNPWRDHVAAQIDWAAAEFGLFQVVGHGIEPGIAESLRARSAACYRRTPETQQRAYLYFGEGLPEDHARAEAHEPDAAGAHRLANEYPPLPGFREAVLDYISALTGLSHRLMTSFGRGLRLGDNYFVDRYTADPTTRLRIADPSGAAGQSDAGLLTMIHQDELSGLQVKAGSTWLDVPYVPDSFIVIVGDSLERLTSGRYAASVRRTVNRSAQSGVALQFSFHPRAGTRLQPIPLLGSASPLRARAGTGNNRAGGMPAVPTRPESSHSERPHLESRHPENLSGARF